MHGFYTIMCFEMSTQSLLYNGTPLKFDDEEFLALYDLKKKRIKVYTCGSNS